MKLSLSHAMLLMLLLSFFQRSTLNSQPSSTNHVLDLDGNGSCVELPHAVFENLDEATVEGWVKRRNLNGSRKFLDTGLSQQKMFFAARAPGALPFKANHGEAV